MPEDTRQVEEGANLLASGKDRLSLLLEVTNLLVSRLDLGDLLNALSDCLGRAVRHEYASISLFEPGTTHGAVVRLVIVESARRPDLENRPISISETSARSFEKGEPVVYSIDDLDRRNSNLAQILRPLGMRSFCSIPLATARATVGLLSVASRRSDAFTNEEVLLLQQVSGQIAVALENGLAFEEIQRLKDRLLSEKMFLEDEIRSEHGFSGITGRSVALREVLKQVETVAPTDASVLLTGETGTGKELFARAIHDRSRRKDRSFVRVNCAAIPSALVESAMFGHERGAFTGAVATQLGRFEVAHGGTLFLDEVGDLPLEVQPKLLRALQEHEFERVGSTRTLHVDVRIIAATNRDLPAMVAAREFRNDLYYRLNVFPVRLPPLRERRDDIPPLVRDFADRHARRLKRTLSGIPSSVMEQLCAQDWPGNVRELENVIERAVILALDGVLRAPTFDGQAPQRPIAPGHLDHVQKDAILLALRAARGIIGGPGGAAARLGIKRTTLQSRMRKLGIERPSY